MKQAILIAGLFAVLLLSGCVQDTAQNQAAPKANSRVAGNGSPAAKLIEVQIKDFKFAPDSLRIENGTTVKWTNLDGANHTVTSAGNFDSGIIQPGQSFSFAFKNPGSFDYLCSIHTYMKANITVN